MTQTVEQCAQMGDVRRGARRAAFDQRRRLAATVVTLLTLVLSAVPVSAGAAAAQSRFTAHQIAVARVVHAVGSKYHASDRAMLAAFEAGLVESQMMANPAVCEQDHDSAGAFQQRRAWVPAAQRPRAGGWCVPGQDPRLRPEWAATAFFLGSGGHRGALFFDDRGTNVKNAPIRTAGELAQAVQVSAYPGRYDERKRDALALLALVDGNRPNPQSPFTSKQICGPGFLSIDRVQLGAEGAVYLLWNKATQQNCVTTIKSTGFDRKSTVTAYLQPAGATRAIDSGRFAYYAGPVRAKAPHCIRWGGAINRNTFNSKSEHCG